MSNYANYILDLLSGFDNIKMRKMFGGYGIYKDNICFALIIEDILYFKVDKSNQPDYEQHGSEPFSYQGKNNKKIVMSYWQVPGDILESSQEFEAWVNKAVRVAQLAKIK